jgi:hypothetical protein
MRSPKATALSLFDIHAAAHGTPSSVSSLP